MPQYGPSASPVLAMRLAMRALGEPPFAFPYSFPYRTDRAVEARLHPPQDIGAQGIGRIGLVRFQNVGMRYGPGPEVLRDVSFELAPGSFHFLAGPSGAGKTSLLKLLYLAHRPSRGLLSMFGQDVSTASRSADRKSTPLNPSP